MEERVAKWIIEFLLRQPIDEKIINGVLSYLPLANNDNRLKKTILLRSIEFEVSSGSISEKLLEFMEMIEELDHKDGKKASNLMKGAYCAVAVDCTVRFLEDNLGDNRKYLETVERVWKNRVCKMEGFASEELQRWFGDIEAAVSDSGVCEKIWMRNTRNEALKTVKGYVKEAWECMGPAFLVSMAKKVGNEVQEFCRGGDGGGAVEGSDNPCRELTLSQGMQNGQALVRRKHVAVKTRRPRGVKISDAGEDAEEPMNVASDDPTNKIDKAQGKHQFEPMQKHAADVSQPDLNFPCTRENDNTSNMDVANDDPTNIIDKAHGKLQSEPLQIHAAVNVSQAAPNLSCRMEKDNPSNIDAVKNKTVPVLHATPEVERVQEALKFSSRELHEAVTDPLPEALKSIADWSLTGGTENHKTAVGTQKGAENNAAPRVDSIQQTSEAKSVKVHAAVQNSTPDAFQPVLNPSPDASQPVLNPSEDTPQHVQNDPAQANQAQDVPRESTDTNIEKKNEQSDITQGNGNDPKEQRKRKPSLMENNDTGHTLDWDDSIDNLSSGLPARPQLGPSPNRSNASPLKPYVDKKRRRESKKWTPEEEDALRDAVKKYGRSWKFISDCYDIFKGRTCVDLKDKWRNMMRFQP